MLGSLNPFLLLKMPECQIDTTRQKALKIESTLQHKIPTHE